MRYTLTWIALMAISAQAAETNFRIFAPGAKEVQVSVDGKLTALTAADPSIPYFTGKTDAPDGGKYKYIIGGTPEPFERQLGVGHTSTWNDFANRTMSYADIPELPWPIEERPQWTRSGTPHSLWDTNYIPTVWIQVEQVDKDRFYKYIPVPKRNDKQRWSATLTYILADEIHTFKNVSLGIHGPGKPNNNDKQSWNWQLADTDRLANRNFFKLRHMEEDPTQIREKTYADIMQALGTPVNEAVYVRMFIDGEGYGTFTLLDDITEYSFPAAMFYNGKPPAQMGALFDGGSGASLLYDLAPNTPAYYSWTPNAASPEGPLALVDFCKKFNETDRTNDAQLAEVDKLFDLDYFMRFMVMEYLTDHWDGYWAMRTNTGLYRDPTENNRWYFIGQDFDGTFGINTQIISNNVPAISYKEYEKNFTEAVVIKGLLENANQRAKFEKYMINTVKVLFNNVTLGSRIDKYYQFIEEDIRWDRTIKQKSYGKHYGWTFEDARKNLHQWTNATGGGGASYGLFEWISKKALAVSTEFNFQLTTEPVGPPNPTPRRAPGQPQPPPEKPHTPDGGQADKDPSSGAALVPKIVITAALAGAATFFGLF
ncbi:hypothetical protein DFQ27_006789 [Actinomortierella ambigua]|uniref:Coth protein-domain-containing protein n=1 Tax=Actinomortierella ambigua TaxID=1343610 RepID=A0A9P6UC41_9FUNG|nr:hypothetical protein DFQ27_006789 [Actinomortierella ambigua]